MESRRRKMAKEVGMKRMIRKIEQRIPVVGEE
jgi:hypothetical protein